ncbi:hypothetical protein B0T14DRAFT_45134 [Immersiella caudata]|uniref:Uncharacterized protein n=1 Tax=Immersiella caudata TaxID=314043 RepID=A0AA39XFT8_9PEZI|nr:hypothetical protein B0T14DRAFT_45134 [Immersiella caudata]
MRQYLCLFPCLFLCSYRTPPRRHLGRIEHCRRPSSAFSRLRSIVCSLQTSALPFSEVARILIAAHPNPCRSWRRGLRFWPWSATPFNFLIFRPFLATQPATCMPARCCHLGLCRAQRSRHVSMVERLLRGIILASRRHGGLRHLTQPGFNPVMLQAVLAFFWSILRCSFFLVFHFLVSVEKRFPKHDYQPSEIQFAVGYALIPHPPPRPLSDYRNLAMPNLEPLFVRPQHASSLTISSAIPLPLSSESSPNNDTE